VSLFADVTIIEAGAIIFPLSGAVGIIFKLLIESYKSRIASVESEAKSWKEMYAEAIDVVESKVNEKRADSGKQPFTVIAPIVPEHSSPVTEEQQKTADLQTARARLTAATLALGLPAREAGTPVGESPVVTMADLKDAVDQIPEKTAEKTADKIMEKLS